MTAMKQFITIVFFLLLLASAQEVFSQNQPGAATVTANDRSLDISWGASTGSPDGYVVFVSTAANFTPTGNNASFTGANSNYSAAPGYPTNTDPDKLVYKGTGTSTTITGLTNGQLYNIAIYAYKNASDWSPGRNTTGTARPDPASAGSFTSTQSSVTFTWTNPTISHSALVFIKSGASITTATGPGSNATSYAADNDFSNGNSGTALNGTDETVATCVFNGPVTGGATSNVAVNGLTPGTTYSFVVYQYDGTTTASYSPVYSFLNTAITYSAEPADHPASFTATSAGTSQIDLDFSAASTITNADGYVILAKAGSAPTTAGLNDGSDPTGATDYLTTINSTSAIDFSHTGLTTSTTYHYLLIPFNYNGSNNATYNYLTGAGATVPNARTASATTASPSATFVEVTGSPVVSGSVLTAGTTDVALTGLEVTSDAAQTLSAINFDISGLGSQLSNVRLFKSTTAGSVGSSIATNASGNFTGLTEAINSTSTYFYLVADIAANVLPTTTSVNLSPDQSNVTTSGNKLPFSINKTFTFQASQTSTLTVDYDGQAIIDVTDYIKQSNDVTDLNSEKVFGIDITDADVDSHPTTITSLIFNFPSGSGNLNQVALYNGTTELAELDVAGSIDGSNNITFTGLNIVVADGSTGTPSTQTLDLLVTFNSPVIDQEIIRVNVFSATESSTGSQLGTLGTVATNPTNNEIEVLATEMRFTNITASISPNQDFGFTVSATDAFGNIDREVTGSVTLSKQAGSGTLSSTDAGGLTRNFSTGSVSWSQVRLTLAGSYTIRANHSGSLPDEDQSITVISLGVLVAGPTQDFCIGGNFTTLNNITLTERDPSDFKVGSGSFSIILPPNFIFNTAVTPTPSETGTNISTISAITYPSNNIASFNYTVTAIDASDVITITGLQVKYTGSAPATASNIMRIGGSAVQEKNSVDDAIPHGSLTASQASSVGYEFFVSEVPGQSTIVPDETKFSFSVSAVLLKPSTTDPATTNDAFSGNGVSFSNIQNSYIFSPASVGPGSGYVVTYTAKNTAGCQISVSKTFQVYSSSIIGLQSEYCTNDNTNQTLSVDPQQYNIDYIAQYYTAWNAATAYVRGNRVNYNNKPYVCTQPNTNILPTNTTYWELISYTFNDFSITLPSFKPITSVTNNGTGTVTITSPNHGLPNGSSHYVEYYVYDANWNVIFSIPYQAFTISAATLNTFTISYLNPSAGTYSNGYGGIYIQSPQVTGVVNNGTSLTITVANHGLTNNVKVRIFLNGLSDNGGQSTRINDWYQISVIDKNTFTIATTATGSWTGQGSVDIFNYKTSTFNAAMANGLNANFGTIQEIYVGYIVNNNGCLESATNTCPPFVYQQEPVKLNQLPILDFTGLSANLCKNDPQVTLTGNQSDGIFSGTGVSEAGPGSNQGFFDPQAGAVTAEVPQSVTYTFTDVKGCTNSVTKTTTVHARPTVNAGPPTADFCAGSAVGVQIGGSPSAVGNAPFNYLWDNGTTLDQANIPNPKASPTTTTTYTLTVTDNFGCSQTDNIQVIVFQPAVINPFTLNPVCSGNDISIPTAGLIGGSATSAVWSTSGTGQFFAGAFQDNTYSVTQLYRPSVGTGSDVAINRVDISLTTNDPSGPCQSVSVTKTVTISPAPVANAGIDLVYCSDKPMNVVGTSSGSASSTTWSHNGQGSLTDPSALSTVYNPSPTEVAGGATITVTLVTNDPDGGGPCLPSSDQAVISIRQRSTIFAGTDFERCQDQSIVMNGSKPANSAATSFMWSGGSGFFSNPFDLNSVYNPVPSEIGNSINLILTSNDPDGTPNFGCDAEQSIVKVTIKNDAPPPSVSVPNPICTNDPVSSLTASGQNIRWYGDQNLTDFRAVGGSYATGVTSEIDKIVKFYVTQTINGCESLPQADSIIINPRPVAKFSVENFCKGDAMEFEDISTLSYNNGRTGTINKWAWNFNDGDALASNNGNIPTGTHGNRTSGTFANPSHRYAALGNYNVAMEVTSSDGCSAAINAFALFGRTLPVTPVPKTNFSFTNVCETDETSFNYIAGPGIAENEILSWNWNFGDGSTSSLPNPKHKYADQGNYNVSLTLTTKHPILAGQGNCAEDTARVVSILPLISKFPYNVDFDELTHGWVTEGLNTQTGESQTSWTLTDPNGDMINSSKDGAAWITRVDAIGTYHNNERSVLNGPCFNIDLDRPVILFDYWNNTDRRSDGVYLETSTDNGQTWERLGTQGQGQNWYDQGLITGLLKVGGIGQTLGQFGWSGDTKEPNEENGWTNAKYNFDDFLGQKKVRIRFVFGSNPDNPSGIYDGFAIDNFAIESRNRTILAENFTNLTNRSQADNNNIPLRAFANTKTRNELVTLQYHTSLGGEDEIFQANVIDPNARAAFYGVTSPYVGYLDGISRGLFGDDRTKPVLPWVVNEFDSRSLEPAPLTILIQQPTVNTDGMFTITTTVRIDSATSLDSNEQYVVHVAVAEQQVGSETYVLRKLLPSATGTPLTILNSLESQNITVSYDLHNVLDKSKIAVIVFVQGLRSKRVLQTGLRENILAPDVVTDVEGGFDEAIGIYPNPADQSFSMELAQPVKERTSVVLYDQVGKVSHKTWFEKGESRKLIDTSKLAAGMYLLQVDSNKGMTRKKVMVVHQN
jgi:hypothetical protein